MLASASITCFRAATAGPSSSLRSRAGSREARQPGVHGLAAGRQVVGDPSERVLVLRIDHGLREIARHGLPLCVHRCTTGAESAPLYARTDSWPNFPPQHIRHKGAKAPCSSPW